MALDFQRGGCPGCNGIPLGKWPIVRVPAQEVTAAAHAEGGGGELEAGGRPAVGSVRPVDGLRQIEQHPRHARLTQRVRHQHDDVTQPRPCDTNPTPLLTNPVQ
eukprot:1182106-Prorocentrum_minimum.AAC.1